MSELRPCPICGAKAKVGYACGDYFVHCSEGCTSPMCDHPSIQQTIDHWNSWADKWAKEKKEG